MRKSLILILSICFTMPVLAAQGSASGSAILSANVGVYNTKDDTDGVTQHDTQVSNLDGTLGYVFSSGIYIGGMYGSSTSETQGATSKPTMTHYGASLGYYTSGGLVLQGHYITSAVIKDATATADRTDGTGTQFDLGFIKNLAGPLFLGAQLSSRTMEYKKLDTAGVKTLSKHRVSDLFPSIRISFIW